MKRISMLLLATVVFACGDLFAQSEATVIVLPMRMAAPANGRQLGNIKVGNNATSTHCDYEGMIQEAKTKARAMGGNLVKITRLAEPTFIGKCYRIEAAVYLVAYLKPYMAQLPEQKAKLPDNTPPHATIYLYRLKDTTVPAPAYDVHLDGDSVLCTVRSRSSDSALIYKDGTIVLWAKTSHREELKLHVNMGAVYYIRCGLRNGELRMVPVIEQVDAATGASEYSRLQSHKKDITAKYLDQIH